MYRVDASMKTENKLLYIGIFTYAILDLITTYVGLSLGATELNPFIKTMPFMIVAKILTVLLIIIFIKWIDYMKDCTDNKYIKGTARIMRLSVISLLLIVGIGIAGINNMLVISAYAASDTGTITYTNETFAMRYSPDPSGTIIAAGDLDMSRIVTSRNYTGLDALFWKADQLTNLPSDPVATAFVVESGCAESGVNGVVTLSSSAVTPWVNYTFFQRCTLVNETVNLTLNTNIFSGLGVSVNGLRVNGSTPGGLLSTTNPAGVRSKKSIAGSTSYLVSATSATEPYYYGGSQLTHTQYNVTYYSGGFSVVVLKDQIAPSKIFVNYTNGGYGQGSYYSDSTFNRNNVTQFFSYGKGIFLKVCFTSTACSQVLVNSTNSQANNTIPGLGGSGFGQIYYSYNNSYVGDYYGFNNTINSSNQIPFSTYYIEGVEADGVTPINGMPITFSTYTYNTSRMWLFAETGTYRVNLSQSLPFGIGKHVIDTATITINQQQYAYSIQTDKSSYYTGQIINVTANNPSPATVYINMALQAGGGASGQNKITDMPIPANSNKTINVTVTGDMMSGAWIATMYTGKNANNLVSSKTFTITLPAAGEAVGLRWGDQNFVGRSNTLFYSTNANASTVKVYHPIPGKNTTTLLDTFSVYNSTAGQTDYLMDVAGTWNATITDDGNAANISYANMTVLGNATFRCDNRLPDYVCFNKDSYIPNDQFTINYKATNLPITTGVFGNPLPETFFTLRVIIYDPDGTRIVTKTVLDATAGSTSPLTIPSAGSISGKFTKTAIAGTYHVVLMRDGTNQSDFTDGIQLADSFATLVVPVPSSLDQVPVESRDARTIIDGWTAMFNMGINDATRLLFAVIIIMIFTASGFMLTGKNSTGGILFGFMPYAFFAFIAYIPLWITIVLVLVVAIKLRWFS